MTNVSVQRDGPVQPQLVGPGAKLANPIPQIRLEETPGNVSADAELHFIQPISSKFVDTPA